jgi:CDP-diacylglycerol--glycerol-3-phosphate 3-phosphatidyltransferase
MVATALVLLVEQQDYSLFTVAAMVIIGREIVVSALREWMAELGKSASVAVSFVGKAKTLAQMAAIFALLLAGPQMPDYVLQAGYVLLYTSAALTLWSMAVYLSAAINEFEA